MAPPDASIAGRLTHKVGPLPVYVWAALILAAGYIFYRRTNTSATATQTTAAPSSAGTSGSDTGAVSGGGGSGTPASNLTPDLIGQIYDVNAGTIDSLTNALISQSALAASGPVDGGPPGAVGQGVAAAPTVIVPNDGRISPSGWTPAKIGASTSVHETQTAPGVLKWGGITFTSKAAFDSWARAHGTTTKRELQKNPQARQIYGTLK